MSENKRMRPSALLKWEGQVFLIDAGPDLRNQGLKWGIDHVDGVLLTHAHHDHTAGLDDLRIYNFRNKAPLPLLASNATADEVELRFHYMFSQQRLEFQRLSHEKGEVEFLGVPIRYFSYVQTGMPITGYRLGNFAYVTDIKEYDPSIFEELKGVEVLVLSALRDDPSPMHLTLNDAVEFATKVRAQQTYLTHIAHEIDHSKGNERLPENIRLAYDGLEITL